MKTQLERWIETSKNVIPHLFLNGPQEYRDRPCLGSKRNGSYSYITYQDLREKVCYFAAFLWNSGFRPQDKMILLSENREEWIVSDLGAMLAGGVVVPVYPTLNVRQMEYIFQHSDAKLAIVSSQIQYHKLVKIYEALKVSIFVIVMDANFELSSSAYVTSVTMDAVYELGKKTWSEKESEILSLLESLEEDDVCSIIYTSGTTGEPKGVMLTHKNFVFSAVHGIHIQFARFLNEGVIAKDLSILPLAHVFARMVYFSVIIIAGGNLAFAENFNSIASNLKEVQPNIMVGVPRIYETIYNRIMNELGRASSLKQKISKWAFAVGREYITKRYDAKKRVGFLLKWKYWLAYHFVFQHIHKVFGGKLVALLSAGAKLNEEVSIFYCSIGLRLTEGYGLTETAPTIACTRPRRIRWGSVGKAVRGVRIKLAEDGEILVKGPNVMKGYYKNEAATRAAFNEEDWFQTGDLGSLNEEGYLSITGRKKDIIVMSNGKNVSPNPIESLLVTSPFIEQALLVGDDKPFISALIVPRFEAVKQYFKEQGVQLKDNLSLADDLRVQDLVQKEIRSLTSESLAKFEQIKKFVVLGREFSVDLNEMTPTLKIKRHVVCHHFAEDIANLYA